VEGERALPLDQFWWRAHVESASWGFVAESGSSDWGGWIGGDSSRVFFGADSGWVFPRRGGSGSFVIGTTSGTGFSSADLNVSDAAMACPRAGGAAIEVRSAAGALVRTFDAPNGEGITVFSRAHLVDDGIGYRGTTVSGTRKWIIDRFNGSTREQTVYLADGVGTEQSFLYPPTTNAALRMGGNIDDSDGTSAIVRVAGPGNVVTIFSSTQPDVDFISGATDMNNADEVAFYARSISTGTFTVYRSAGGAADTIAVAGALGIDSASMAAFPPSISDNGWVAFRGKDASGDAIFVGDGTDLVRVIGHGAIVNTDLGVLNLGFTFGPGNVQAVSGPIDMNGRGQIVFAGVLSNGTVALMTVEPCLADFNNDGVVDLFDYLDFVQVFADNAPEADFNNDLVIDLFDYLDYVQAFAEGC
jgi:hypothetical protein